MNNNLNDGFDNRFLASFYEKNNYYLKAKRVRHCGTLRKSSLNNHKLTEWLCHDPMCSRCRQHKVDVENAIAQRIANKFTDYTKIMFTITYPSIYINYFGEIGSKLNKIFQFIKYHVPFKKIYKGHVSRLSFSKINEEGKINLHLHGLLFASQDILNSFDTYKQYFIDKCKEYSGVDIKDLFFEKIEDDDALRVAQYTNKEEFNYGTVENVNLLSRLYRYTTGKRTRFFGGCYRDARREIKENYDKEIMRIKSQDKYNYKSINLYSNYQVNIPRRINIKRSNSGIPLSKVCIDYGIIFEHEDENDILF